MDCEEITKGPVALEILQNPEKIHLQNDLFDCIYRLFHKSFINWILGKYSYAKFKDKLLEDAKDAFQNGMMTLFNKSQKKDLQIRGSLKTTVFSFGLFQMLAYFKKDKLQYGTDDYILFFDAFNKDQIFEKERNELFDEKERRLMNALEKLPKKYYEILVMRFFYKMRSKEIADKLGVSVGNVDNITARAYKLLPQIMNS